MCNLYRLHTGPVKFETSANPIYAQLSFPEGIPNYQPRDVAITDAAPIIRAASNRPGFELVTRRWSWPDERSKKPVFNFRSDGREFDNGRCLIVTNGFYEFTKPEDPKAKRKDRWLFRMPGSEILCIAGLWREVPGIGEAFTMLTTEPGPDVAPYHNRQVAILTEDQWAHWLDPAASVKGLIGPLPAGTLRVEPSIAQAA